MAINFRSHLIVPLYLEPQRHYHNLSHIHRLLREIDMLLDQEVIDYYNRQILDIAAWMHDAYYDPKAAPGNNERRSADMLSEFDELKSTAVVPHRNGKGHTRLFSWLVETVEATAKHTEDQLGLNPLTELFLDIDLCDLGADPTTFHENTLNIRKEYAHVPMDAFVKGRIQFCQKMLDRESIYYHPFMKLKYEKQAIKNLENEIEYLKSL